MRRQVPLVLCFAFGIVMALTEFSPHPFSQGLNKEIIDWALVIGPFALVLAIATLVQTHWVRIRRRSEYWRYSFFSLHWNYCYGCDWYSVWSTASGVCVDV